MTINYTMQRNMLKHFGAANRGNADDCRVYAV